MFYRYDTMTKQGKFVVFLAHVEVLQCGLMIKCQIGNPSQINSDGTVVLPQSPTKNRIQPKPSSSGLTPQLNKFRFKPTQQSTNTSQLNDLATNDQDQLATPIVNPQDDRLAF